MLDDQIPLPWPRKGDQIFTSADDWWHNACLYRNANANWTIYSIGYKRAGDTLVEHIKATHTDQDFLVYPIVFLYRQYIELTLKRIVKDGHRLLENPETYQATHDLQQLWSKCRIVLRSVEPAATIADLEAVCALITQFCEVDPSSFSFRYPVDKQDKSSLPDDLLYLNVRNLAEVVDRIGSFLDGAVDMIMVYLEQKNALAEEYTVRPVKLWVEDNE